MVRFTFGQGTSVSSNLTTPLPADHPAIPSDSNLDQCPVDHSTRSKWLDVAGSSSDAGPSNSTPPSPQNPFYSASPASGPRNVAKLSKDREISSIPRAQKTETQHIGSSEGANQKDEDGNWVYPSEEQFFNAMQRKNHKPRAGDMRSIVPIHNAVNERAWEEILAWEAGMGSEKCGGPRLVSFAGKPKQRTPKAWINTALG
jgi:cytochrome c heme-lyase